LQPTFAALCALAAIIAAILAGCEGRGPSVVLEPREGSPVTVSVEVADTPETVTHGLMYRSHLGADRGMLFLFERDAEHTFWMKNTTIPLDMIFLSRDGRVVGVHSNAEPLSLKPISIGVPSRAVLEVNGGFAAANGITAGDAVRYQNIRSAALPAG
jgi:uncharacterized protein